MADQELRRIHDPHHLLLPWLAPSALGSRRSRPLKHLTGSTLSVSSADGSIRSRRSRSTGYEAMRFSDAAKGLYRILSRLFGDACTVPFGISTVRTVLSLKVFARIGKPQSAVIEVMRLLDDGGPLTCAVPIACQQQCLRPAHHGVAKSGLKRLGACCGWEALEVVKVGDGMIDACLTRDLTMAQEPINWRERRSRKPASIRLLTLLSAFANAFGWVRSAPSEALSLLSGTYLVQAAKGALLGK